jgi:hypothetical protein
LILSQSWDTAYTGICLDRHWHFNDKCSLKLCIHKPKFAFFVDFTQDANVAQIMIFCAGTARHARDI